MMAARTGRMSAHPGLSTGITPGQAAGAGKNLGRRTLVGFADLCQSSGAFPSWPG
jgi:hypothetical protein